MIRIDWTNPITKGLVFASVGSQPDINLVDGARPSDGTTFAVRPGADGLGLDPNDLTFAPTDGSFWNKWHDSGRTFGFATYSLLLRETDTGVNDTILEIKINSNRHTLRFVNAAQNETISVSYYDTTETQINAGPVATPIGIDGKAHGAACSCESDGTLTLYGDGISLGTPGTTSNPGFLAQTINNGFGVGNDWTGGTNWPGLIYLSLLWTRPLSAVEHAQLHANPWQIFIDTSRPIIGAHQLPTHVDYGMVKVPWTKQPPTSARIDWSNPLTRGLVSAFNFQPGPIVDLVTGKRLDVYTHTTGTAAPNDGGATIDAPIYKTCRGGMGIDMQPRSGPTYTWLRNTTGIFDLTDFPEYSRLIGIADFDSSGSGNPGLWRSADNSLGNDFDIYGAADDGWWLYVNGLTKHQSNNTDVIALGPYENHSISYGLDGDTHAYIDGRLKASDANGYTAFTTNTVYNLGCQHTVEKYLGGTWTHLYIWNRELTEGEHKALGENPWQIFKPQALQVPINEDLPELGTFEKPWDDMPL